MLCVGLCGFSYCALAAEPAKPATQQVVQSDPSLVNELEQLQGKLAQVRDLSTRFVQEKHTPLLRKPLMSDGRIRIVGNLMRWDTQKPAESVMLISESEIRLYYPKQKLMEVYRLDQQLARMMASPIPRISVMQEHFDLVRPAAGEVNDAGVLAVTLLPRQETLKQHIQQVRLMIDRESAYLRQMEMVDADGDRTVIRFEEVKLNSGLSAEELELKPPADTRISYPLSAESNAESNSPRSN